MSVSFPKTGLTPDAVMDRVRAYGETDADWRGGRTWSLVYFAEDELLSLMKEAYTHYMCANALSPFAFPSLRRFEEEVVQMTVDLLGGGSEGVGTMTSGGTESILMAIKAARERARDLKGITEPEMVLPITVHPAFEKAAHYFGVKPVHIPTGEDFRADVAAAKAAISENTVLMVGSAPAFPHGVVDPIRELASVALEHDIPFHVDACLGGFLLPWVKKLGHEIPDFDLSVPGVTSMSADLHKYGFATRGASTVVYKNSEYRKYQFFAYTDWPGGLYGSPSMTGSRPGGAIAAAWAALTYLGEEGYLRHAKKMMDTTQRLKEGIEAIDGLRILGEPHATVFAFTADELDVYGMGDAMKSRGWELDVLQNPPGLHLMVTPAHEHVVSPFLEDLAAVATQAREGTLPPGSGMSAMYGMAGAMPDKGPLKEMIVELLGQLWPARG